MDNIYEELPWNFLQTETGNFWSQAEVMTDKEKSEEIPKTYKFLSSTIHHQEHVSKIYFSYLCYIYIFRNLLFIFMLYLYFS